MGYDSFYRRDPLPFCNAEIIEKKGADAPCLHNKAHSKTKKRQWQSKQGEEFVLFPLFVYSLCPLRVSTKDTDCRLRHRLNEGGQRTRKNKDQHNDDDNDRRAKIRTRIASYVDIASAEGTARRDDQKDKADQRNGKHDRPAEISPRPTGLYRSGRVEISLFSKSFIQFPQNLEVFCGSG